MSDTVIRLRGYTPGIGGKIIVEKGTAADTGHGLSEYRFNIEDDTINWDPRRSILAVDVSSGEIVIYTIPKKGWKP